jgi:hypothetical protein
VIVRVQIEEVFCLAVMLLTRLYFRSAGLSLPLLTAVTVRPF